MASPTTPRTTTPRTTTPRTTTVVVALGTSQTLAWASSYYIPAILAVPMARDLGLSTAWVFGSFSAALLLTAVLGPAVGRVIDARGGRDVLVVPTLVLAAGRVGLAFARGPIGLAAAWAV